MPHNECKTSVADLGDGSYTLSCTAFVSGTVSIEITVDDLMLQLEAEENIFFVAPNQMTAGEQCRAAGEALVAFPAGTRSSFTIAPCDMYGNAQILSTDEAEDACASASDNIKLTPLKISVTVIRDQKQLFKAVRLLLHITF
jgi:hypothetical protein